MHEPEGKDARTSKSEHLVDRFQSACWHFFAPVSRYHSPVAIDGVKPDIVTLSMLKQKASDLSQLPFQFIVTHNVGELFCLNDNAKVTIKLLTNK